MPDRAKRPCSQPGCPNTSTQRYCEKHKDNNRATAARKQYDITRRDDYYRQFYRCELWTRTRKHVLMRDPLCKIAVLCEGRAASTIADHIIPARIYPGSFYDVDNLQGCCKRCHDHKTATEDSKFTGSHASNLTR